MVLAGEMQCIAVPELAGRLEDAVFVKKGLDRVVICVDDGRFEPGRAEVRPEDVTLQCLLFRLGGSPVTEFCLLYTSPSPRDQRGSRMPSSA